MIGKIISHGAALRKGYRNDGHKICIPATMSEMGTVDFKEKRATCYPTAS